MSTSRLIVALASCCVLLLAGCRSAPIYNVTSDTVASPKASLTMEDVATAINRAGATLGWQMQETSPGHMIGTLHLRKHVAVVDVTYDTRTFAIVYKDSTNLDYDGTNIHKNYNGWIQNLERGIRTQLSIM
jgi:hypothetical protein